MRYLLEGLCALSSSTRLHHCLDLHALDLVPTSGHLPDFQGAIDSLIVPCWEQLSSISSDHLAWAFGERQATLSILAASVSQAKSELFFLCHRFKGLQD